MWRKVTTIGVLFGCSLALVSALPHEITYDTKAPSSVMTNLQTGTAPYLTTAASSIQAAPTDIAVSSDSFSGYTQAEVNQRMTGLLLHVRWLISQNTAPRRSGGGGGGGGSSNSQLRQQVEDLQLDVDALAAATSSSVISSGLATSSIDTSAELLAILGDESGSGRSLFSISPAFSGTATFAALTASSTVTLSGTAANIALGSNYLSGDGGDEGIYVNSSGSVGIGTSAPYATLTVAASTVSVTGSELVTNGTFTGNASGWSLGDCATYGSNKVTVTYTTCSDPLLSTDFSSVAGTNYQITFTLSNVSGDTINFYFDNDNYNGFTDEYGIGTHTINYTATYTGTETLYFSSFNYNNDATWQIDDVSIKETNTQPGFAVADVDGSKLFVVGGDYFNSLYVGKNAGFNNTGSDSIFIGSNAGYNNAASNNLFIGTSAGYTNTTGILNTFVGDSAGYSNLIGQNNTFLGAEAGYANLASGNTFIGDEAGRDNTNGALNTFVGGSAGANNTTGSDNTLIGYNAGVSNSTGFQNVFIGRNAGIFSISGSSNFYGGYLAGRYNNGSSNVFIGSESAYNSYATSTVAIGQGAMYGGAQGYVAINNVALGYRAGYAALSGADNNILIGYQAADNLTTGNNNIVIGYNIDNITATADNRLNIGNLLFGTGLDGAGSTLSSGNIGIGTTSPLAKLSVTNTGSGSGFLVEDQANDASPFIINSNGQVGVGTNAPFANYKMQITDETSDDAHFALGVLLTGDSMVANSRYGGVDTYVSTESGNATNFRYLFGVGAGVSHNGTGVLQDGQGIYSYVENSSSGTITTATTYDANAYNNTASSIITNLRYFAGNNLFNAGTITNTYGLYLGDLTSGTQTNQAYSIYASDAGTRNYFAGNTGIGTSSPNTRFTVTGPTTPAGIPTTLFSWGPTYSQELHYAKYSALAGGNYSTYFANNFQQLDVDATGAATGIFNTAMQLNVTGSGANDYNYITNIEAGINYTGGNSSQDELYGADVYVYNSSGYGLREIGGGAFGSGNRSENSTTTTAIGVSGNVFNSGGGTLITEAISLQGEVDNSAGGTITSWYGLKNSLNTNGGTITDTYGVYVGDVTTGTQTNTPYSFYASDINARNYFGGSVGIGTTSPSALLALEKNQAADTGIFIKNTNSAGAAKITIMGDSGNYSALFTAGTAHTYTQYRGSGILNSNNGLLLITDAGVSGGGTNSISFLTGGFNPNTQTRMLIDSTGKVGIGTTTPAQKLQVFGDIRVGTTGSNGCIENYGGGVIGGTCSSDAGLKTDVVALAESERSFLEGLTALTPVTYKWNDRAGELYQKNTDMNNTGLIAQDVQIHFPELVSFNDDGFRQVDFGAMQFYIIEALKELWEKVQGHDERLESLEQENEYLKDRILHIENELDIEGPSSSATPEPTPETPEPEPTPEGVPPAIEPPAAPEPTAEVIVEEPTVEPTPPEASEEPTYVLVPGVSE